MLSPEEKIQISRLKNGSFLACCFFVKLCWHLQDNELHAVHNVKFSFVKHSTMKKKLGNNSLYTTYYHGAFTSHAAPLPSTSSSVLVLKQYQKQRRPQQQNKHNSA